MRVHITSTASTLASEISDLERQINLAQEQARIMMSVSCADLGLEGQTYQAIENRIQMRSLVISSHCIAYQAILDANTRNLALVSALPTSLNNPAVLDLGECERELHWWTHEKMRLEREYEYAMAMERARPMLERTSQSYLDYTFLCRYYNTAITAAQKMIEQWTKLREAAIAYERSSNALYSEAQSCVEGILKQSTDAVRRCIEHGSYSGVAILALKMGLNASMLELAAKYCTTEELAALKKALADGRIDAYEIYSEDGDFNELLYSALAKLPTGLVMPSDVEAIADAYTAMWVNKDTDSIERLIALSYTIVAGEHYSYRVSFLDDSDPDFESIDYYLFRKSPLLARVSGEMTERLPSYNTNDEHFQWILAGTNLMHVLENDNHQFWSSSPEGIKVKLDINTEELPYALLCGLVINPSYPVPWEMYYQGEENQVFGYSYYCATGQLEDVAFLLNDLKLDKLNPTAFDFPGTLIRQGSRSVVSLFAKKGSPLLDLIFAILDESERAGRARVVNDNTYNRISKDRSKGGDVLGLGDYAINIGIGRSDDPEAYKDYEVKYYLSDKDRALLDTATNDFREYLKAHPDLCLTGTILEYDTDVFIKDMESDLYNTIVKNSGHSNATCLFIAWCKKDAGLVYRSDTTTADGMEDFAGSPVIDPPTNYDFIRYKDTSFKYFEYNWK